MKKIRYEEANEYKYKVPVPFEDDVKLVEKSEIAKLYNNNYKAPAIVRRWWFIEKNEILQEHGKLTRIEDFVRDVFPEEYLQDATLKIGETDGKGSILITTRRKYKTKDGITIQKEGRKIIKNDYKGLRKAIEKGNSSTLIFPFTVYGNRHKKDNAHKLHAMVIDIDYVGTVQMKNIIHQIGTGHILAPTYLVSSGNGVHLWYLLDKPVNMTKRQGQELLKLKRMLIRYLWNNATSSRGEVRDSANAYQGFRPPEGYTKLAYDSEGELITEPDENGCDCDSYRATCYKMNEGRRYTITELREMMPPYFDKFYVQEYDYNELPDMRFLEAEFPWEVEETKSKMTLEEAKEKYSDWYARKIEGKESNEKKKSSPGWVCNPGLYEWWKAKVFYEAVVGGRYFAIRALAQYGKKCDIPEEQIRKDAYELKEKLDQISISEDEADRFTDYDVECALATLKEDITNKKQSTRKYIEETTHIRIPTANRNGRTREQHINYMNYRRGELGITDWRNKDGAPKKEAIVREWQQNNPDGTQYRCAKETGLSKNTVKKWWRKESED